MKALLTILSCLLIANGPSSVTPNLFTDPVSADADDPAIWIHPSDPTKSIVFGTDKIREKGGIYAFNLDGKAVQRVENLDRPNNCDVEYDVAGQDILVTSERMKNRLRVFSIDKESGRLSDISGETMIFEGETGERREPMGVGLYKDSKSKRTYAVVSRSAGPTTGYLGFYELVANPATKKIDTKLVRTFGNFSGKKEIEAVFVDDELGLVYYSDETHGVRKYAVADLDKELPGPDTSAFKGDHEGIALYSTGKGTGYLVCTDQIEGNSVYNVFDRVTNKPLGSFSAGIDDTDGIEVVSANLGPKFPKGLFVGMNSQPKNFAMIAWPRVSEAMKLPK